MPTRDLIKFSSTSFGKFYVNKESLLYFINSNLIKILDIKLQIQYLDLLSLTLNKVDFLIILKAHKGQMIDENEIDYIRKTISLLFKNTLGMNVESINVGFQY